MSVVVRAEYHENDVDSNSTAYIIGIYIKNRVRKHVFHVEYEAMVNIVRSILAQQLGKGCSSAVGMRHFSSK